MKTILVGGVLLASALALAACGQNDTATTNAAAPGNTTQPAAADANAAGGEEDTAEEGGAAGAPAGAQQDFQLVNNTGRTLMTLNVSPNDTNEWGPDILGAQTVANGASGTVQFARGQDQCLWDIRATFDGGETGDWRGVNLCETTTITLTPTG